MSSQNCSLQIFDVNGKSVKHLNIQARTSDITLGELPSGMYYYRTVNSENTVAGKLILSDCR